MRTLTAANTPNTQASSMTGRSPAASVVTGALTCLTPTARTSCGAPFLHKTFSPRNMHNVGCQTDDLHLKSKDELVARVEELTLRQSSLIDKIQELTLQLEEIKKQKCDNYDFTINNVDAETQTEAIEMDEKSYQTDIVYTTEGNCEKCQILLEETKNLISTIRILETDKNNIQPLYHESLSVTNRYSVLEQNENDNSTFLEKKVTKKKAKHTKTELMKNKILNKPKNNRRYRNHMFSTDQQPATALKNPCRKIYIFGDSHAKGLSKIMQNKAKHDDNIFTCANSGARMNYVLKNCCDMTNDLSNRDMTVIIAGNNDVSQRGEVRLDELVGQLKTLTESQPSKSYAIVNLFHRYDLPYNSIINKNIKEVNKTINKLGNEGVWIVNVNKLGRHLFTRHGQHLNSMGKTVLCEQILGCLKKPMPLTRVQPENDVAVDEPMMQSMTCDVTEGSLTPPETPEAEPFTLPFDNYADAVKSTQSTATRYELQPTVAALDSVSEDSGRETETCSQLVSTEESDDETLINYKTFLAERQSLMTNIVK